MISGRSATPSARFGSLLLLLLIAGFASSPADSQSYVRATPAQIKADPARWDGRSVEVDGVLVWEFEKVGLYDSYEDYCRGTGEAIYVDWRDWRGFRRVDNRRQVRIRGMFRNRPVRADRPAVSNAALGPGPLRDVQLVSWLSRPGPSCR